MDPDPFIMSYSNCNLQGVGPKLRIFALSYSNCSGEEEGFKTVVQNCGSCSVEGERFKTIDPDSFILELQ